MVSFFLILAPLISAPPADGIERLEAVILKHGCYANHKPDPKVVRQLLRVEVAAGFAPAARGLVVAAACNESGFNPRALGDWYSLTTGKRCKNNTPGCAPKSFGMFQFQGWAKRHIRRLTDAKGDPRFDWHASATYWAKHVAKQVPRVERECGYPDVADVWMAAHRTAVMFPKCARYRYSQRLGKQVCAKRVPRCHRLGTKRQSKHWEIARMWQKIADKSFPRPVVLN